VKASKFALPVLLASVVSIATAGEIKPYSQAQFDTLAAGGKPIVLAVHAPWCPTCKAQKPILDALMTRPGFKDVTTLTIDFDTEKALLTHYKVGTQSTLIAFKGAKEVGRTVGDTTPTGIEGLIKKTVN
jgi:thioredoxin 1